MSIALGIALTTASWQRNTKCDKMTTCYNLLLLLMLSWVCDVTLAAHLPKGHNSRPIIGILTQEVVDDVMKPFGKTYIPAAYVKFIESSGSMVIPVRLNQTLAEYEKIFKSINGLLFIGGAADLETSDFARDAGIFYKLALKANDVGDHFPVWGTCMGFQLLTVLVAEENLLTKTTAENLAFPLNLTAAARSSRMFNSFPPDLQKALSREPLTGNFHHYGIAAETFKGNEKLERFFSVLSTNVAENGVEFVSTMEGRKYPFYGVQWHPEINQFEWDRSMTIPHSENAVRVSSLLGQFFINEASVGCW
ncbi:gamma-glutamyl hydrolase isoform X2 [Amia ocellicauda]|uniref:gamma-glutamyl hydrolase isoform X2 n=1 Tax=Amia ocellicauda TaxID=2972642 RepID=UPI003463CB0E